MQTAVLEKFLLSSSAEGEEGEAPDVEKALTDELDRAALFFVSLISDKTKDDSGNYAISLKERREFFELGMEWLVKRKKTNLGDDSGDDLARTMQQQIAGAKQPVPDKPPPRPRGRPTREAAAAFKKAEDERLRKAVIDGADEDSGWQRQLKEAAVAANGAR